MKKRIISLVMIVALTLGTYTVAVADEKVSSGATRNKLKSKGSIVYQKGDETVVLDSEDLYTLADQIDLLKIDIVDQLESMNTYFTKGSGVSLNSDSSISVAHSKAEDVDAVDPLAVNFDTLLEGIAVSQTIPADDVTAYGFDAGTTLYKNVAGELTTDSNEGVEEIMIAPAEAENLSAGTAAWVDGSLILGTGGDNKSYYDSGSDKVNDAISDIIGLIYSGVNMSENYTVSGKNGSNLSVSISSKDSAGPYNIQIASDQIKVWDLEGEPKRLLTKLEFNVDSETSGHRDSDGATVGYASIGYTVYDQNGQTIGSGYSSSSANSGVAPFHIDMMSLPISTQYIYVEAVGSVSVSKSDHGSGSGTAYINFRNVKATYLIN